jgi:hypothetical protein
MQKPTVRNHIKTMIKWYWSNRKTSFRTRDIQGLSRSGMRLYGRRLGSPSTYDRVFREMKADDLINVKEKKTGTDSIWYLEGHKL